MIASYLLSVRCAHFIHGKFDPSSCQSNGFHCIRCGYQTVVECSQQRRIGCHGEATMLLSQEIKVEAKEI